MSKTNILMFLDSKFQGLKQRPFIEALARELSHAGSVVCLEPWAEPATKISATQTLSDNLSVVTPDLERHEWACDSSAGGPPLHLTVRQCLLDRALECFDARDHLVTWFTNPRHATLVGLAGEDSAVYYRSYGRPLSEVDQEVERQLIHAVNIVFAASERQLPASSRLAGRGVVLPSGVDYSLFSTRPVSLPQDIALVPRPRIGHVGRLDARVNVGLFLKLVQNCPDKSFIQVGRIADCCEARQLVSLPNFYPVGVKNYQEIPAYIDGLDVGLMLYKSSESNGSVHDPFKLYEYLAVGIPVVSTRFSQLGEAADMVWMVDAPDEFADCIQYALLHSPVELRWRGRELARSRDWSIAAGKALEAIGQLTAERRAVA